MRIKRYAGLALAAITIGALCFGAALAAVDFDIGIQKVSDTGTLADCSAKAKAALESYLPGATESSPGSGEWIAMGQNPVIGVATSAATVRCYAMPKGYVATFACAAQTPANPYGARALCLDVAHKFYGGPLTPLAAMPTPTPVPSGCATTNLVGTWVSDSDPKTTLTMTLSGDLSDSEGVSGNWNLDGMTVTLTYYGTHTMTLTPDGKHLHGGGYAFTRKC